MVNEEFIPIGGIQLAVKIAGEGENTILFIHGSCMSSDTWLPQLNDENLSNKYQLIAFDLPGNGKSGWYKSDKSGYRPKKLAMLVKEILAHYQIRKYILAGLSYGTNIIGEISPPLPGCVGILLEGVCIVNDKFPASEIITPGPNGHVIVAANPTDQELSDYVFLNVKSKKVGERYIETYRMADPAFREELGKATFESDVSDELENIKNWNLPVCIMFGKEEKLIRIDYLDNYKPLWNNKTYVIDNASHVINEEAPLEFNKVLLDFASERFK